MTYVMFFIFHSSYDGISDPRQNQSEPEIDLDCGRPVSFSYYDDLIGISLRYSHPTIPDPEVIYVVGFLFESKQILFRQI